MISHHLLSDAKILYKPSKEPIYDIYTQDLVFAYHAISTT